MFIEIDDIWPVQVRINGWYACRIESLSDAIDEINEMNAGDWYG